ncbi:hypothetical protein LCI18_010725 [Fusarium solani-melongenae]|uniref:Uncharacterized protein n=1 Tax=Fusarium solani subsp. cucurbitae TaxID=2747967 RepID=A0ACD3ZF90_FUSSC|nr:hypothetical protein LCI18_010725 [Fusarium solani-melongenae]
MATTVALLLWAASQVAAVDLKLCNRTITNGLLNQSINPHDSIFFYHGGKPMSEPGHLKLTIDGCHKMCPEADFGLYEDMWPRILTWLLPALLLVGNLHVARVGTVNRLFAMLHFMGDPIDSLWSLLTKAEVWNRFYAIALRATPRGPDYEASARALAAILSAFEELTNDMPSVNRELENLMHENGARLAKQDMDHILLEAAEELVDSRSNEVLRTCVVIINYLCSVLSALIPEIGGEQTSQPGGRIGTAMFLSWLVTIVMLSNTLSGFVSRRTCLRIMERYCRTLKGKKRDQHIFPNSPMLVSKIAWLTNRRRSSVVDFIDAQPWTGSLYNFRPKKVLITGGQDDRSPFYLFMLSLAPVLIAGTCALVLLWFTPTVGLDCRSLWVISCAFALMLSPGLTWLIQVIFKGQVAWYLTVAKDTALGIPILIVILCSSIGVFNTCTCWSGVFSRGAARAYITLDPLADRKYNAKHIYPAMVATCLGLQLVVYGLMFRIMRPGAKVFRPDEDTKMDIYRRVHGLQSPGSELNNTPSCDTGSGYSPWGRPRGSAASSEFGELLLPPPAMSPKSNPQRLPSIGDSQISLQPVSPVDYFRLDDNNGRSESVSSFGGSPRTRPSLTTTGVSAPSSSASADTETYTVSTETTTSAVTETSTTENLSSTAVTSSETSSSAETSLSETTTLSSVETASTATTETASTTSIIPSTTETATSTEISSTATTTSAEETSTTSAIASTTTSEAPATLPTIANAKFDDNSNGAPWVRTGLASVSNGAVFWKYSEPNVMVMRPSTSIAQEITGLRPGLAYRIRFIYVEFDTPSATGGCKVTASFGGEDIGEVPTVPPRTPNNVFEEFVSAVYRPSTTSAELKIAFTCTAPGQSNRYYVEDVSIEFAE